MSRVQTPDVSRTSKVIDGRGFIIDICTIFIAEITTIMKMMYVFAAATFFGYHGNYPAESFLKGKGLLCSSRRILTRCVPTSINKIPFL